MSCPKSRMLQRPPESATLSCWAQVHLEQPRLEKGCTARYGKESQGQQGVNRVKRRTILWGKGARACLSVVSVCLSVCGHLLSVLASVPAECRSVPIGLFLWVLLIVPVCAHFLATVGQSTSVLGKILEELLGLHGWYPSLSSLEAGP